MAVIKRRNNHMIPPHHQPMMKEVVEDELESMKQGIVTILRTDINKAITTNATADNKSPPPSITIRRTLSADMSSKKWLAQNGLSLTQPPSKSNAGQESIKSPVVDSILTINRKDDCISNHKPYVPRPINNKRSSSSTLSQKSIELCTETLGSETGSDSFPSSSYHYADDYQQERDEKDYQFKDSNNSYEDFRVVKYRSAPVRPFPPPIPSITSDGDSLSIRSHRENGRLVMEAVSSPPKNYLHARRGDGRLVLTLIRHQKAATKGEVEGELAGKNDLAVDQELKSLTGNKNPTFAGQEKARVSAEEGRDSRQVIQIAQSLPCTGASPFIAYEYFWRNKTNTSMAAKRGMGFVNTVVDGGKSAVGLLKNYNTNDAKKYMNRDPSPSMEIRGGEFIESSLVFPYLKKGCKERNNKRSVAMADLGAILNCHFLTCS